MATSKKWSYKTSSSSGAGLAMFSAAKGTIHLGPPGSDETTLKLQVVSAGAGISFGISKLPLPKSAKAAAERAEKMPTVTVGPEEADSIGSVIIMPGCKNGDLEVSDFLGPCTYYEASGGVPLRGTQGGGAITFIFCGLEWYQINPTPATFALMAKNSKAFIPMACRTDIYGLPQIGATMGVGFIYKEKEKPLTLSTKDDENEQRRRFNKPAPPRPPENAAQYVWQNFQHNTGRTDDDGEE